MKRRSFMSGLAVSALLPGSVALASPPSLFQILTPVWKLPCFQGCKIVAREMVGEEPNGDIMSKKTLDIALKIVHAPQDPEVRAYLPPDERVTTEEELCAWFFPVQGRDARGDLREIHEVLKSRSHLLGSKPEHLFFEVFEEDGDSWMTLDATRIGDLTVVVDSEEGLAPHLLVGSQIVIG